MSIDYEVDPRKIGQMVHGAPVVNPDGVEDFRSCYVVAAVGSAEGRRAIRADLDARGFTEIEDYCAVA